MESLGGSVVDEQPADGSGVALDVSEGPVVWALPPAEQGLAGQRFESVVSALAADAQRLVTWRRRLAVLEGGPIDPDTGVLREQATARIAARLWPGDAIICLGLDVPDPDRELVRRFAGLIRSEMRLTDHVGLAGEGALSVLARNTPVAGAEAALTRLRRRWRAGEPPATFSAGIAMVGPSGTAALQAARATLDEVRSDRSDAWDVAEETGEGWQPEISNAPTSQDRKWSSGPDSGGH